MRIIPPPLALVREIADYLGDCFIEGGLADPANRLEIAENILELVKEAI